MKNQLTTRAWIQTVHLRCKKTNRNSLRHHTFTTRLSHKDQTNTKGQVAFIKEFKACNSNHNRSDEHPMTSAEKTNRVGKVYKILRLRIELPGQTETTQGVSSRVAKRSNTEPAFQRCLSMEQKASRRVFNGPWGGNGQTLFRDAIDQSWQRANIRRVKL